MAVLDREQEDAEVIIRNLKDVYKYIPEYQSNTKVKEKVSKIIADVRTKAIFLVQRLEYLNTIKGKFEAFDFALFKVFNQTVQRLKNEDQKRLQEILNNKLSKLSKKYHVEDITARCLLFCREFETRITRLEKALKQGKLSEGKKILKAMIKDEKKVEAFISRIKKFQERLIGAVEKALMVAQNMR